MKKSTLLFTFFFLVTIFKVNGQARMTFTAGISPQQTPVTHYIFVNRSSPRDEFTFDLSQVKASYFIGAGVRYDVAPFFFQGEMQYNKREYVYDVAYTFPGFGRTEEAVRYTESMNVLNFPLSLGVDLGLIEVVSGFLPQVIMSQQTELESITGYSKDLSPVRFGWHTGLAADISGLRIGLNWQMDFNNYADHLYIRGESIALQGRSTRLLGILSYNF